MSWPCECLFRSTYSVLDISCPVYIASICYILLVGLENCEI